MALDSSASGVFPIAVTPFLPDVVIASLEAELKTALRPWCDTLWQACGMERSLSFDPQGNWRERGH